MGGSKTAPSLPAASSVVSANEHVTGRINDNSVPASAALALAVAAASQWQAALVLR